MDHNININSIQYYRGRCRCCLTEGYWRSLTQEYADEKGKRRVFNEMYTSCFKEQLAPEVIPLDDYLICESCILKLDECEKFQRQVAKAKKHFELFKMDPFVFMDCLTLEIKSYRLPPNSIEANNHSIIENPCLNRNLSDCYQPDDDPVLWDEVWQDFAEESPQKAKQRHYQPRTYRTAKERSGLPYTLEKGNLTCSLCHEHFFSPLMLNAHMNIHYPNFICDFCGKAFAIKSRLRKHLKSHVKSSFPCALCDRVYSTYKSRYSHMRVNHSNKLTYRCPQCCVRFLTYDLRLQHLIKTHGVEAKRHSCKLCQAAFMRAGTLSAHTRTVHLKEKTKTCDVCGAAFFTKSMLDNHMACHSNRRDHLCHVCHRSYARRKTLLAHMKIHNKEEPSKGE